MNSFSMFVENCPYDSLWSVSNVLIIDLGIIIELLNSIIIELNIELNSIIIELLTYNVLHWYQLH